MARVAAPRLLRGGLACLASAVIALATPHASAAQSCAGDCAGDGIVSIADLVRAVNIALGLQPLAGCPAVDSSDMPGPDCSHVAAEIDSFFVGNTPFDLDYELGRWPEPWGNRAYVALHGGYISWTGARIVGIGLDAMTGQVLPGSDLPGVGSGEMVDFATGWADNPNPPVGYGRPTVVAFAPDGRLFLGNDTTGVIVWFAPLDLAPP